MRTTLASGAWIEHVPVQDLKGRHKRDYERAARPPVPDEAVTDDGDVSIRAIVAGMDVTSYGAAKRDALWAILIDAWSYDLPVPQFNRETGEAAGAEALDELPLDDYEEIGVVLAPHEAKITRRPDPKGSTTSASNGSSPARAGGSRRG